MRDEEPGVAGVDLSAGSGGADLEGGGALFSLDKSPKTLSSSGMGSSRRTEAGAMEGRERDWVPRGVLAIEGRGAAGVRAMRGLETEGRGREMEEERWDDEGA